MMSTHPQTIKTYDDSAKQFAEHFTSYKDGVARTEINQAFALAPQPVQLVIEIGCGAGKDAVEIVKRTQKYIGFDPAAKLLAIAKKQVKDGIFVQADALSYNYPPDIDIVFAFASMLHLNKDDFSAVCDKVAQALRPGGVFCITLKEADAYTKELQTDNFGTRLFYLYPPKLVQKLAGPNFRLVHQSHTVAGPKARPWMSLLFVKT